MVDLDISLPPCRWPGNEVCGGDYRLSVPVREYDWLRSERASERGGSELRPTGSKDHTVPPIVHLLPLLYIPSVARTESLIVYNHSHSPPPHTRRTTRPPPSLVSSPRLNHNHHRSAIDTRDPTRGNATRLVLRVFSIITRRT